MLFVSGQLPLIPGTASFSGGDISSQTIQALANIAAIVEAAGFQINQIVKCTVFLKNMGDFSAMNAVYQAFFQAHKPARAAVEVARLPKDALVEIEAICMREADRP